MSRFREALTHLAQGLLMGGADIIPGVSGGTMALIVGIYERLIASLTHGFAALVALIRGSLPDFREHVREVEWLLIVPLGLGIGSALLIGARIIPHLLETYPHQMAGLFFGLIAGSLVIPWIRIGRMNARLLGIAVVAAVAAFLLVGLPPQVVEDPGFLRVFFSASIAICAMILPGISGAYLLLVLGMYQPTLEALNARDLLYVGIFGLGAVVGLGLFSRLLNYLLTHRHDPTMAALVGLMAGSLRALWPWAEPDRSLRLPESGEPLLLPVLLAIAGLVFILVLTRVSASKLVEPARHQA